MKIIGLFFILLFLTACSQNIGMGIGVAGISTSGNNMAATEIVADSDTGIHGSVSVGTDIRL
jgi:hypothetical protein